ncbi:MAG: ABC transporter permease subunit [Candidatus Falkowbacteria bacterium]|nr:ABC transporter permease subunit [Candidatus Falkowbacteria bacterium]
MRSIYILFQKELMHYFNSPIAYIFIAVFLLVNNWLFFSTFFIIEQVNMREFFHLLPWFFLFFAPAITMRLWAEEKKTGTIEFLLTLPITYWQACLAKFLSAVAFLTLTLACTFTIPVSLHYLGNLDIGPIIGSYAGAILLGAAYISLGLFISSLTKNQIISLVLGIMACFIFFVIGSDIVTTRIPTAIAPIFQFAGLSYHFDNISRGVIDSKDIIFYLSFIFFFLWLNVKKLELNRK